MLSTYQTKTQRLLFDPGGTFWSTADVTAFINEARGQIAAEGQCVRILPTPASNQTAASQEVYTFASANTVVATVTGASSILSVQSIAVSWGSLKPILTQWDWGDLQARIRAYPIISGQPAMWAQFGQGKSGSVYIEPVPTSAANMDWDCVCLPVDLVDDTTAELIPYPWTDCVPYYAAYLAFMTARRPEEAKNMFAIYADYMRRARTFSDQSYVPDYYA